MYADEDFDQMIRPLLEPEDGDVLQVLYLKLANGMLVPFIGAPMAEKEWENIDSIGRGEYIQVEGADEFEEYVPPKNLRRCYQ